MKPTEADLIELENHLLPRLIGPTTPSQACVDPEMGRLDRVGGTLRYLIDRARFHNRRAIGRKKLEKTGSANAKGEN